eukprot:TRINITY_DN3563_c0_g2_i1.p1 TRINITY_DN3563_c0_g2~~TRINITY_DN3563_c0_g2_i1.p1  ORF type:complete len:561 (+),score=80.36 TRINITY_DN3563_c0_g2_i1:48-1730(+)
MVSWLFISLFAPLLPFVLSQGRCPRDVYVQYYGKQNIGAACTRSTDCKNYEVPSTMIPCGCIGNVCSILRDEGDACSSSSNCKTGICYDSRCRASGSLAVGSQCSHSDNCEDGLYCNYQTRVCAEEALVGEICFHAESNTTTPCFNSSRCPITTRERTDVYCQNGLQGLTSDYCNPGQGHCASTHFCSSDRQPNSCQPLRDDGIKCNYHYECKSGSGCDSICRKYYSLDAGLSTNSSKFCKLGLITLDNICSAPPALNTPCGSDDFCNSIENKQLLACSCSDDSNQGTCQLILPPSCHAEAQEYFSYEVAKDSVDRTDIKWTAYLCCLQNNLKKTEAAYWLSDLGKFTTESLDCDEDDGIPGWLIFVIVLIIVVVIVCCVVGYLLYKKRKKRLEAERLKNQNELGSHIPVNTDAQPTVPATGASIMTRVKSNKTPPPTILEEDVKPPEKVLMKELQNLSELKSHPLSTKRSLREVSAYRNICTQFANCPAMNTQPHCDIFMHECPEMDKCRLTLDADHCLKFWHHVRDRTVCTHPVATCPDIADPVHQQRFEHLTNKEKS